MFKYVLDNGDLHALFYLAVIQYVSGLVLVTLHPSFCLIPLTNIKVHLIVPVGKSENTEA